MKERAAQPRRIEAWRAAARAALGRARPGADVGGKAELGRLVRLLAELQEPEGARRWVTVSLDGGELRLGGEASEASPEALAALLELLAGAGEPAARTLDTEPGLRVSTVPEAPAVSEPTVLERQAAAVEDVCVAVGRTGAREALDSPAVADALAAVAGAFGPAAVGARRWVGRLRLALARRHEQQVAGLLASGFRFAEAARARPVTDGLLTAWTGRARLESALPGGERHLLELGRERLDGFERGELQVRHLLDLESGGLLVEAASGGAGPLSVGPWPRRVRVALAEHGASPWAPWVRPLQYVVSLGVGREHLEEVEGAARGEFATLLDEMRAARVVLGELAEPVVLVRPARVEGVDEGQPVPIDATGTPLPLQRSGRGEGRVLCDALRAGATLRWVLGRLLVSDGRLLLRPVSAGVGHDDSVHLLRLR